MQRVDPYRMFVDHLRLDGSRLAVAFEDEQYELDLAGFNEIVVLGAGKASARMARAMEDILGERISRGLVVVKYGHGEPLRRVEVIEAGHPVPDASGEAGARRMALMAQAADEKTLIVNLVSGGGSALLPYPADGVTLADKQATTNLLLASGACIGDVNCVRKHISAIKGGRLLRMMAPARSLNFILSDVPDRRLDTIASGLTVCDASTFAEALGVIEKYGLRGKSPTSVVAVLEAGAAGRIAETPKPGDPSADYAANFIIGDNQAAVAAARGKADALGYHVVTLTSPLTGEAREAATRLYEMACSLRDRAAPSRPVCLIAGGETTVTLKGTGKGGRNQELTLAFLGEMARDERRGAGVHFLSASTDGSDGPTDAAGAFASARALEMAGEAELSIADALAANDFYHFFDAIGHLLRTGPTLTNVCDLQIAIVE